MSASETDKLNSSLDNSMLNSSSKRKSDTNNSIEVIDLELDVVEDNFKEIDKIMNNSAKKIESEKSTEKK